jgi:hypothetical protein
MQIVKIGKAVFSTIATFHWKSRSLLGTGLKMCFLAVFCVEFMILVP